jgi:hypothetical protein
LKGIFITSLEALESLPLPALWRDLHFTFEA